MATVLVTGANRGIGLALVQQYAARGDTVHAVVRRQAGPALRATGAILHEDVELTDAAALARLLHSLGPARFDLVMLNAGILRREALDDLGAEAGARILEQFLVNALAPLQLAAALRGHYARGARLGLLTSRMGSIADNTSGGYYGYRMSKAALNAAGASLAHDLRTQGVAVCLLHPGFVRTDMTGGTGERSPEEAAAQLVERLDALTPAQSGAFLHASGAPLPW
jgi:NAD(P)-dependent dehydrogenase (short-subunit alcohol dehydrogenase family)